MRADAPGSRRHPTLDWLSPAVLALAGSALLAMSWRRWNHFLIDFGRELYIPWQLIEGKTLFADVSYFNGPLSPYLNALAFRLFGPSLTTLLGVNLTVFVVVVALLYWVLLRLGGRWAALLGGLVFLVVFGLADLTGLGNYNFIAPYSHEMTHGTLLSLGLLAALFGFLERGDRRCLLISGFLLGLIFLTKAEFLVAAMAAAGSALLADYWIHRRPLSVLLRQSLLFGSVTLVPPVLALTLLVTSVPLSTALTGVFGSWAHVSAQGLTDLPFYQRSAGIHDLSDSLQRIFVWSSWYLIALYPALRMARRPSIGWRRSWRVATSTLWAALSVVAAWTLLDPSDLPRPLPFVLLLGTAILVRGLSRVKRSGRPGSQSAALLVTSVFALLLLLKIFFATRFNQYGFALAMPATMVFVVYLLAAVPEWIDRRGGSAAVFRAAAMAFLATIALGCLQVSALSYARKSLTLGDASDAFRATPDAVVVQRLLPWLDANLGEKETLAVLPEGVMLNYLLRRENPTSFINFIPPEFLMFGQEAIVRAFENSPPDVVVLIKRNALEYGYPTIGDGYGEGLMAWVQENYGLVEEFHEPRLEPHDFARALVLRRLDNRP